MSAALAPQMRKSTTRYIEWKEATFGEVLRLFRSGMDTLEIAMKLELSEAEVERRIHVARSNEARKKARFE